MEEVTTETAAFRAEAVQLKADLRELRGEIAETMDELGEFGRSLEDTKELTDRDQHPDA